MRTAPYSPQHEMRSSGLIQVARVRAGAAPLVRLTALVISTLFGCTRVPSDNQPALAIDQNRSALLGAHLWSGSFGSAGGRAYGHGVAVDANGSPVITGEFYGNIDFEGQCGSLTSVLGSADVYLAKFSAAGVCQWAHAYGDASTQLGAGVAIDSAGNIFAVGSFWGAINFGCGTMQSNGDNADIYLAKLTSNGECTWSQRFGDSASQFGRGVAVDADDSSVVITGEFFGAVDFGGGWLTSQGGADIYLAKLSSNGLYQQARAYGDAADQFSTSIAVDSLHNVILTGNFNGSVDFGGGPLASTIGYDVFVAELSPELGHQWSRQFGDIEDQFSFSVAADSARNVIITGAFYGAMEMGYGIPTLASAGGTDIFIAKLDLLGIPQWAQRFGDERDQSGTSVYIGPGDSIFLAGSFRGTVDFGDGPLTSNSGSVDVFMAKFAGDGRNFGGTKYGDARDQFGEGIAVDLDGRVALVGSFAGTMAFGSQPLTAQGVSDVFLARFEHACDGANCNGCCDGNTCRAPSVQSCGTAGGACYACDAFRADRCETGLCRCGVNPACALGQHCVGGACVCDAESCASGCCRAGTCNSPSFSSCGTGGASCVTCDPNRADTCSGGQCRCGPNPSCAIGQRCQGGACVCDGLSCPNGCCDGLTCRTNDLAACRSGGLACTGSACNPIRADNCFNGQCRCGSNPACDNGQRCVSGNCVCNTGSGCAGCCEGNICRQGDELTRCGAGGQACVSCPSSTVCSAGSCQCPPYQCGYPNCRACSCGDFGQCGVYPACTECCEQCGTYPFCHECCRDGLRWCESVAACWPTSMQCP